MGQAVTISVRMRGLAGWLLWGLLAGYLVFNKPFGLLGFPPLYIGEMVLAVTVLAALTDIRGFVIEPLQESWPHRLAAFFFLFGAVRAVCDFFGHGQDALRDSVTAVYALLAFLAPVLWKASAGGGPPRPLTLHVARVMLPLAIAGALWAAAVSYACVPLRDSAWASNKPDFTTLTAAVAAWAALATALRFQPFRRNENGARSRAWSAAVFAGGILMAAAAVYLVRRLPTRAVYLSALPLAGITLAAWAHTQARRYALAAALAAATLGGSAMYLSLIAPQIHAVNTEYGLDRNLDFSIDEVEQRLRTNPEVYPDFDISLDVTDIDEMTRRERLASLLETNEDKFSTLQGRRGAHAVKWRLAFWVRSCNYVLHHAPLLGIGFGRNITNLLRETPAWPMFIPAMSLRNRNPHSAHVTVLTRMGLLGLLPWLAILAAVLWVSLHRLWSYRAQMAAAAKSVPPTEDSGAREAFWSTLLVLGVWTIYVWTMSFGVVLENPFGGMWFWALTGVLLAPVHESSRFSFPRIEVKGEAVTGDPQNRVVTTEYRPRH